MARYRGPVAKVSRRLNIALTDKAQKVLNKRPFPPGQHGAASRRRQLSDYGIQLQEKQKARYVYGVHVHNASPAKPVQRCSCCLSAASTMWCTAWVWP
jgi:ribosomal protein S4